MEVVPQSPEHLPEVLPHSPESSIHSAPESSRKKHIVVLKNRSEGPFGPEQTIYLCGTSHVSKQSCEDVRELIQAVKPQVLLSGRCLEAHYHVRRMRCTEFVKMYFVKVVMMELCEERKNILRPVDPNAVSGSQANASVPLKLQPASYQQLQ